MKKIILSLLLLCLFCNFALANNQGNKKISQKDAAEQNKLSNPNNVPSATDNIKNWAYEAIKKFGVDDFGEHNGKFFFFASQAVSLKPIDPQFGDALVNAYDKALLKLQSKYLITRFGRIAVKKIKSFYSNRSTHAKEIELPNHSVKDFSEKILKIIDKSLDVAGKKLDKKLIQLGVDPAELEKMTPTMKKDIFRDKFIKSTLRQASGSIAGLFPIQTALATDKSGRYVVGIIAVASPKTFQIVKDISLHRASLVEGKGRNVKDLLPNDKKKYLSTFGVRLTYDLDGAPMIISYGIGSYSQDGSDSYINDQLRSEAKQDAISNADGAIAEIVNGYMSEKQNRKNGEEIRKYIERKVKPNSDTIENSIRNIIKITNNNVRNSARESLKGVSTVKTWRYTTKEGVKFVGAVRVWRYSTLKAVNDFNNDEYHSKKTKVGHTYQKILQKSKVVNDINDF
ncbi:hypothetical protein MNBD_DELTA04-223 [hydrothermal vent metagenome]|uniref:DUF6844 domain-containing protein n=1 Tax=hydrothermal vent metagenome TaxID=652676 RepID=A0A3B0VNE5_9ZZZZ